MFLHLFDPFSYKKLEGNKDEEEEYQIQLDQRTSHISFELIVLPSFALNVVLCCTKFNILTTCKIQVAYLDGSQEPGSTPFLL